jgi:hypothetical protein
LRDHGWAAVTTRSTSGAQQGDDLVTNTGLSWEVKDHVRLELSEWISQARRQSGGKPAVVIHKRRGVSSPDGWYVTMLGDDLLRILGGDVS